KFTKMHGAGNDFIMIDDRALTTPFEDYQLMSAIAARRTGIGCEGIILVQPSDKADFRMRFLNPDGTEVELCGNGARCVALFARSLGLAGKTMTMETMAGLVDAEIGDGGVRIWMPDPSARRDGIEVETAHGRFTGHEVSIGCPHFVVPLAPEALDAFDVATVGAAIRQHAAFSPEGVNVDFVAYAKPNRVRMRTFERGVEAESGACGTGAVAAAVVGVEVAGLTLPAKVTTTSGFELTVDGDWRGGKCTGMTLSGPARKVFDGEIDLDAIDGAQDF
ncbi:MAG: diaminopimelate epimerase, partial [Kiritimatiellae bacterium]|nr:diaminopimelate epimerase [Kiritimatiellia bacterium]